MMDDEFYYQYLGSNALSSSSCSKLLESPKRYLDSLNERGGESQPLRDGWLFHCKILEPEKWKDIYFVDVASKASKVYKEALSTHDKVFTLKEKFNAEDLSEIVLSNSKCVDMLRGARTEVPAIGEIFDIPFRAKADVLGGDYIVDLKTTSGDLQKFRWSADKWNYDMQMYIYCTLFDISYKNFTFVVVDKFSKALGVFECSKDFYESGKHKTQQAINIYKSFFIEKKKPVGEFYIYDVL
jgi:hypothetical protein